MTEQELIEQLADKEHASWARWMEYLFSKCLKDTVMTGAALIPAAYVRHWLEEIKTAYADLPEQTKQSDRDEVAHILPIIREYVAANATQEIERLRTALEREQRDHANCEQFHHDGSMAKTQAIAALVEQNARMREIVEAVADMSATFPAQAYLWRQKALALLKGQK